MEYEAITVTPVSPATDVEPAPSCGIWIVVPFGKATAACVGTVTTLAAALFMLTMPELADDAGASVSTSV